MTLATSPAQTTPALEARALTAGYRAFRRADVVVLRDLELSLAPDEYVCLIGPNGTGKSTLLRTFAGIQRPLAGEVGLGGALLPSLSRLETARRLSVVLTERVDAGTLPAYDVVALGRHPHTGWSGRLLPHDHAVVWAAITAAGAAHLAERNIQELSDGERQRVMIARALAQEPRVVLLDEPTAFLDAPGRIELALLLRRLAREQGVGVVQATHDLDLALQHADTIWLLDRAGQCHAGAPEDLLLSGAIGETFAGDASAFDPARRAFRVGGDVAGTVRVLGDGLEAAMARSALAREGYRAAEATDASLCVEACRIDGRPSWHVTMPDGASAEVDNLAALARIAREAVRSDTT
jgi:iron complex transport system ATP-binding protein